MENCLVIFINSTNGRFAVQTDCGDCAVFDPIDDSVRLRAGDVVTLVPGQKGHQTATCARQAKPFAVYGQTGPCSRSAAKTQVAP